MGGLRAYYYTGTVLARVDSTVDFLFPVRDFASAGSRDAGKEKKERSLGTESY